MVQELGRLTQDVNVRVNNFNGVEKSVLNNSLAIKNGKDMTTFVNFTAWGKTAELIGNYLKKGDEVLLRGELRNSKREIDGKTYTNTYLLVTGLDFVSGNKRNAEKSSENVGFSNAEPIDEMDIPF
jgi:single-strand DNA-binding protein